MVDHIRHHTPPKNRMIYPIDYGSLSLTETQQNYYCQGAIAMDFPFEYEASLAWMKKRRKVETTVFEILGSCNGLICLGISTGMYKFEEDDSICIWNPVTSEYKTISLALCDFYSVRYEFGYDSNIDDYKLVRVSDDENTDSFKIEVYTLGSDSWSTIQTPVPYSFPADVSNNTTNQKSSSEVIVSFHVSSERLVDLSLPEEAMPLKPPNHSYGSISA
ncbi:F-box/kelch-repeat protein At3g06240-like [Papaver somniferum]|uniref:F-box/kelch-repeat protein At3g06240-like n=1 Tax=Papaver somniferum TaxID=3469 RepID=UPI000E704950|nr:F-box/kelch-repeat protein At3g06240-like [Papaver somniferum]